MEQQQASASHTNPGLVAGLMAITRNMFGLVLTRIELAALELSEVRSNFLKLLMVFAVALMAVWFALAYWTMLVVFLAWDTLGWRILPIIAAGFTAFAAGLFWYARAMIQQGKLSMPATMAELRNDHDAIS